MSHPNQIAFVKLCSPILEDVYPHPTIAEMGAYDVNGSTRPLFKYAREYVGVDLTEGPSVDVVASAHEFGLANHYDVVLACEVFEHNPFWMETFLNMIRICRPGGTVLFTCASRGRPEHGTARTLALESPGTSSEGWNYYRNLNKRDFLKNVDLQLHFIDFEFFRVNPSQDLYFVGIKRATLGQEKKTFHNWINEHRDRLHTGVNALNRSNRAGTHSLYGRIHSSSLYIAALFLSDKHYQSLCYWGPLAKAKLLIALRGRK